MQSRDRPRSIMTGQEEMILNIWNLAAVSPRTVSSFSFAVVNVPSTGLCFRTHPLFSRVQFQFQFIVLP